MTITGEEVRTARETLGLSRRELADMIGTTPAKVGRIEHSGPRPDELDGLAELLRKAGVTTQDRPEMPAFDDRGLPPAPDGSLDPDDPDAQVVLVEWRGLRRGNVVRVDGEKQSARFRFGYYFKSPTQEYVAVYSTKNGGERCVRPERLRDQKGKELA